MTVIEQWVRHILDTDFEKFDKEVVEEAKRSIIDVIGCSIGGANADGCSMIVDLVKEWGGKKEATILAHRIRSPAHNAAMVNSIMSRSFDYESGGAFFNMPITCHIGCTTVPTAFAVAECEHSSGKELITALVVGGDITARLMAASIPQLEPWDNAGTAPRFGATAIAGKLQGLDDHQLLNAFGIVVNQVSGSYQCIPDGSHSFKLLQGLSARDGITSSELAKKGWTGIKDPLLSKYGYFALYCQSSMPEFLTRDLGKFFPVKSHKAYPSCGRVQSASQGALELVRKHDIKFDDIVEVKVNITDENFNSIAGQPFQIGESAQTSALFNIQYGVASALLRKDIRLEYYTDEYIRDSRIMNFTKKVKIAGKLPPEKAAKYSLLAAEVKIRMKDGKEYDTDPIRKQLTTTKEIVAKFRNNIAFSKTVTNRNAEKALSMLMQLEEIDDVSKIVKLLVA